MVALSLLPFRVMSLEMLDPGSPPNAKQLATGPSVTPILHLKGHGAGNWASRKDERTESRITLFVTPPEQFGTDSDPNTLENVLRVPSILLWMAMSSFARTESIRGKCPSQES